jgi:hypothetical protein
MRHIRTTDEVRLTRRDFLKIASGLGLSAAGMTFLDACGVNSATQASSANQL